MQGNILPIRRTLISKYYIFLDIGPSKVRKLILTPSSFPQNEKLYLHTVKNFLAQEILTKIYWNFFFFKSFMR